MIGFTLITKLAEEKTKIGLQKIYALLTLLTLTLTILIIDTVDVDGDLYETQK